jgi:hypothetical protein
LEVPYSRKYPLEPPAARTGRGCMHYEIGNPKKALKAFADAKSKMPSGN